MNKDSTTLVSQKQLWYLKKDFWDTTVIFFSVYINDITNFTLSNK